MASGTSCWLVHISVELAKIIVNSYQKQTKKEKEHEIKSVKYSDPLLALLEVRDTERQVIIIESLSKRSLITVYTKMKETTSIFCIRNKQRLGTCAGFKSGQLLCRMAVTIYCLK